MVKLARLAVDRRYQGRGIGAELLRDTFLRTAQAADRIGAVAMMLHAKDDQARAFYERYGFRASPLQALQLFLPMKTLRAAIAEAASTVQPGTPG